MRYENDLLSEVQVHFRGNDENRTISVNGYIPLTAEQYSGNESVSALETLVRQEVANKIMQDSNAE